MGKKLLLLFLSGMIGFMFLPGGLSLWFEKAIPVQSIDDLVKIADELNKPLIYKPVTGSSETQNFYICDGKGVFFYELKI